MDIFREPPYSITFLDDHAVVLMGIWIPFPHKELSEISAILNGMPHPIKLDRWILSVNLTNPGLQNQQSSSVIGVIATSEASNSSSSLELANSSGTSSTSSKPSPPLGSRTLKIGIITLLSCKYLLRLSEQSSIALLQLQRTTRMMRGLLKFAAKKLGVKPISWLDDPYLEEFSSTDELFIDELTAGILLEQVGQILEVPFSPSSPVISASAISPAKLGVHLHPLPKASERRAPPTSSRPSLRVPSEVNSSSSSAFGLLNDLSSLPFISVAREDQYTNHADEDDVLLRLLEDLRREPDVFIVTTSDDGTTMVQQSFNGDKELEEITEPEPLPFPLSTYTRKTPKLPVKH